MNTTTIGRAVVAAALLGLASAASAQGFVFGTEPAKKPQAAQAQAPVAVAGDASSRKIETAQRLLSRMGLLKERPSGVLTAGTRDAIRDFSARQGMASTGAVNDALLATLRRVIWQSQNYAGGGYKGKDKIVDAAGLREAQQLLTRLGFDPGPVDGTFGPNTQVATEAFQESQGVAVDGLVTPTALMNMRRAVHGIGNATKDTLRVANWPDYIDEGVLTDFEREFRVRIIYETFADNDDLIERLAAKGAYDVVFPTANAVPAMAARGLLAKLDRGALKNLDNIDPRVDAALRTWDKDGAWSVPYMWYTIGIAWNPRLVARVAPNQNMEQLAAVFDPDSARRLAACGVGVVDSASDIVPLAALAAGKTRWEGRASIDAAAKVLDRIAGVVKVVPTDEFVGALAEGKLCVALGYSGDAVQAQGKSRGAIEYRVPEDGGLLAIDAMAIGAGAQNKAAAHQFLNYLMRPQVIARVSNAVGYANANLKAGDYMRESIRNNPAVVPNPSALSRSRPIPILSEADQAEINRVWARFSK